MGKATTGTHMTKDTVLHATPCSGLIMMFDPGVDHCVMPCLGQGQATGDSG